MVTVCYQSRLAEYADNKDLRPFLGELVAYDIDRGGGHWLLAEYAERKT